MTAEEICVAIAKLSPHEREALARRFERPLGAVARVAFNEDVATATRQFIEEVSNKILFVCC